MAVYSEVDVINLVLPQLTEGPVSVVDGSPTAQSLHMVMPSYLRLFQGGTLDWRFLRTNVTLGTPQPTNIDATYQYTFVIPADCLRVLKVCYSSNVSGDGIKDYDLRGRYLLVNTPSVYLLYLRYEDNFGLFEFHFVEAFSLYLANKYVMPKTKSDVIAKRLEVMYAESLRMAMATELRLASPKEDNLEDDDLSVGIY